MAKPVHHVENGEGVEIAVPGSVFEARLRREAHRRIHGSATVYGTYRRAATEMARHEAKLFPRLADDLGNPLADPAVGSPVESVAPHPMLLRPGPWDAVLSRVFGHGPMETGLQHRYQHQLGPQLAESLDGREVDAVVKRSSRLELAHGRQQIVVH